MSDSRDRLNPIRFWNRAALLALILAVPVAGLVALWTNGTALAPGLPIAVFAVCSTIVVVGYLRIRTFRCPRCGHYFTIQHRFGMNSRGRKCAHCGLDAYA